MTAAPDVLETAMHLLSGIGSLRTRKMFGGTYIYCDDLFIATVHDNTLYLKANEKTAQEFVSRGLKPFSYRTASGTVTLRYYQAPPEVFGGRAQMKPWALKALGAAKQRPHANYKGEVKGDASYLDAARSTRVNNTGVDRAGREDAGEA